MVSDKDWLDDHKKWVMLVCTNCFRPAIGFEEKLIAPSEDGFYYIPCLVCGPERTEAGTYITFKFAKIKKNQLR